MEVKAAPDGYRLIRTWESHRDTAEPLVVGILADRFEETEFARTLPRDNVTVRKLHARGGPIAEQLDGVHGVLVPPHPALAAAAMATPAPFAQLLLQAALDIGMPIRALNEGTLLLNVAAGGTLRDAGAAGMDHAHGSHGVIIMRNTVVERSMGGSQGLSVSSRHSLAIDRVAPGFEASGISADGNVEAIEKPGTATFGLQFVPQMTRSQFERSLVNDAYAWWDENDPLYHESLEKIPMREIVANKVAGWKSWLSTWTSKDNSTRSGCGWRAVEPASNCNPGSPTG